MRRSPPKRNPPKRSLGGSSGKSDPLFYLIKGYGLGFLKVDDVGNGRRRARWLYARIIAISNRRDKNRVKYLINSPTPNINKG